MPQHKPGTNIHEQSRLLHRRPVLDFQILVLKSGTTALQESFDSQSLELKQNGIVYPNIGRKAHHRIAWALSQRTWGWNKKGGEKTSKKEWTRLVKAINADKSETVLLSSEFFSELDTEQIQTIFNEIRWWCAPGRRSRV